MATKPSKSTKNEYCLLVGASRQARTLNTFVDFEGFVAIDQKATI